MPSNNQGCVTPEQLTQNRQVRNRRNPSQMTDLTRRIEELDRAMSASEQASSSSGRFKQHSRFSFKEKMQRVMHLTASKFLVGQKTNSFNLWLANNWAVWKRFGQLGSNPTTEGFVRQTLKRAERLFTNDLPHQLGKLGIEETIANNWDEMQRLKKFYKIKDVDFHDLAVQAVELSYSRFAKQHYNAGAKGLEFINGRFDNYVTFMKSLGIDDVDQEYILQMGREVAESYEQALGIAQEFGINARQLQDLGFFPRQFTEDIQRRFAWRRQKQFKGTARDPKRDTIIFEDGSTLNLGQAFMKSRNTTNFVVEDEIVLDAFLDANGFWEQPSIKAMLDEGKIQGVRDLFDTDNFDLLNRALFDNLSDNQLEVLSDNGILSKIPMSSTEVREWMSSAFKLPSEDLDTIMATDWVRAYKGYESQLKKTAGKSGLIWTMIANATSMDGRKMPWGVPQDIKAKDELLPESERQFDNFVKLFPEGADDNSAMLSREMMEFFVRGNADNGRIPQAHVHPVARDLFNGMLDVTTNPIRLGMVGETIRELSKTFKRTAVTSFSFVSTQFVNPIIQIHTAGGNFLQYPQDVGKMLGVMRRMRFNKGFTGKRNLTMSEALDEVMENTRKVYKGFNGELVTEKELYQQARRVGFLNDYTPDIGQEIDSKNFAFSRGNFVGTFKMMQATMDDFGVFRGLGQGALDSVGNLRRLSLDPFSSTVMMLNSEFENAGRFTTLKSLTYDTSQAGGGFLKAMAKARRTGFSGGQPNNFETLEGAMEHTQNYFFAFDDQGKMDKLVRDFVIPFWSYVSRNPVAQLRGATRNPIKYGNFLRITQNLQGKDRVEEKLGTPVENVTPKWLNEQRPIWWNVEVDETPDGESRTIPFYLPSRPYDPVGDAFQFIGSMGNQALEQAGVFPKRNGVNNTEIATAEEDIPFLKTGTNQMFDLALENSFGLYKGVAGAVLERRIGQDQRDLTPDPFGRRKASLFGLEIDPRIRFFLSETFPLVERINNANPLGIFGTRGGFVIGDDGKSIELTEPERSLFGGERTDFDQNQAYDQVAKRLEFALGNTLARINFIDPMFVGAKKIEDVRGNINEFSKQISIQRDTIARTQDPQKRRELQDKLQSMIMVQAKLRINLRRLEEWADEQGLEPMDAFREMQKEQLDLPGLSPATRQEILRDTVRQTFEEEQDGSRQ